MQFNPGDGSGIIDLLQDLTVTQSATGSSYLLVKKTRDINNALGWYMLLANQAEGRWQVDDTNQTDYPVIYLDLVSGQQDYAFTVDADGNKILDIYKIRIKDQNGKWTTLKQRDIQDGKDYLHNNPATSANIHEYDVTSNGIFLTDIPNFSQVVSIEVTISRTPTYFVVGDTTKEPGIPILHEYLAFRPAYFYCLTRSPELAAKYYITLYGSDGKGGMEKAIKDYFSQRNRDERPKITPRLPSRDSLNNRPTI